MQECHARLWLRSAPSSSGLRRSLARMRCPCTAPYSRSACRNGLAEGWFRVRGQTRCWSVHWAMRLQPFQTSPSPTPHFFAGVRVPAPAAALRKGGRQVRQPAQQPLQLNPAAGGRLHTSWAAVGLAFCIAAGVQYIQTPCRQVHAPPTHTSPAYTAYTPTSGSGSTCKLTAGERQPQGTGAANGPAGCCLR